MNDYLINGDIAYIKLDQSDGYFMFAVIDTFNLSKVLNHPYKWRAKYAPTSKSFYAVAHSINDNGDRTSLLMHRFIMNIPSDTVDHENHNTLDNRESKLKIVSKSDNCLNRKGANKSTKSGIRGVSWSANYGGKWRVRKIVRGITHDLGYFTELKDAAIAAKRLELIV